MAQGRFLSRTIATSRQLAAVSDQAEVLFYRMIPHIDVAGRLEGEPELVKAQVIPLKRAYTVERIAELLTELSEAMDPDGVPLVRWYRVKGRAVLEFPGFSGHQSGLRADREAKTRLPGWSETAEPLTAPAPLAEQVGDVGGVDRELVRNGGGPTRGKVSEGKSKGEGKSKISVPADAADPEHPNWSAAWARVFSEQVGEISIGRVGKRCKPVRVRYGPDRAFEMWELYCRQRRFYRFGKFDPAHDDLAATTPEDFAKTARHWYKLTEPLAHATA